MTEPALFGLRTQCKSCPWKKDADPFDIPNGYSVELHRKLLACNASNPGRIMACHMSKPGEEFGCVGWLVHELGAGNNIVLRIDHSRAGHPKLTTIGEQHACLADTIPEDRS